MIRENGTTMDQAQHCHLTFRVTLNKLKLYLITTLIKNNNKNASPQLIQVLKIQ